MTKDLLFEIGTEEIPARFIEPALVQIERLSKDLLRDARLEYKSLSVYGTPRRLCLYVEDLANKQKEEEKEVRGPAKRAAFDEEGKPTRAAQGFAKSQGVEIEELVIKELNNGEYVFAIKRDEGLPAQKVLPDLLEKLITSLSFPKSMRWGEGNFRFARPIHWLTALFGEKIIPLSVAGVKSDRFTFGHRFLAGEKIILQNPKAYFQALKNAFVIVDQEQRADLIRQQIKALETTFDGQVELDQNLLSEVVQLVEYPTSFIGEFDAHFLKLPEEVIINAMKEHQRYFPIRDAKQKLLPKFLAVRNGLDENIDLVKGGNEKVLAARLADAYFFYEEDLKEPLENKVEGLKEIVFQEKLGNLWEKTQRIQKLAVMIAKKLDISLAEIALIQRTAFLAKADLTTNMVNEFPELQGIIGGYYALKTEDPAVAQGIKEQYLPRFSGDIFPESQTGIIVGIADKVDTLVGCFLAGLIPTGSQDPYGLRRQALGVCNTIIYHRLPISLKDLINTGMELYGVDKPEDRKSEVLEKVIDFYKQRLENILQEDKGIPYDVVGAVLAVGWEYPFDVLERAKILYDFMGKETFLALITGFTRAFNLAKNATQSKVNEEYLIDLSEKELYKHILTAERLLDKYLADGNYYNSLEVLASLREPIDEFFDEVMVMVEDEKIKENRLALLGRVVDLAREIGDLSKLVVRPD